MQWVFSAFSWCIVLSCWCLAQINKSWWWSYLDLLFVEISHNSPNCMNHIWQMQNQIFIFSFVRRRQTHCVRIHSILLKMIHEFRQIYSLGNCTLWIFFGWEQKMTICIWCKWISFFHLFLNSIGFRFIDSLNRIM